MGRLPKNYSKNSINEEENVTNTRKRSKSKAKKDERIVQSTSTKPAKQKQQRDRLRSLPISIQKSLIRIRDCDSQGPSPTPENDIFYQQNSNRPSALRFKNPNFQFAALKGSKKRLWKNLKQILTIEKSIPWQPDDPTYMSIEAPPSLKPAKKYSDLSGLPANYKDPLTQIRYSTSSEFSTLRTLPSDIVQGYLALRKANFLPS